MPEKKLLWLEVEEQEYGGYKIFVRDESLLGRVGRLKSEVAVAETKDSLCKKLEKIIRTFGSE